MDNGNKIAIISLIVGVVIALIPYLWKKFIAKPELTIEIKDIHGSSWQEGISNKNDISKGYIDGNNAIYISEVTINCIVIIRNSSPYTAFYPNLIMEPNVASFTKIDNLNNLKPIVSAEEILLKAVYVKFEECKGGDRSSLSKFPNEIKDMRLLLEYKNSFGTAAHTLYKHSSEKKNIFLFRKPKEFKSA